VLLNTSTSNARAAEMRATAGGSSTLQNERTCSNSMVPTSRIAVATDHTGDFRFTKHRTTHDSEANLERAFALRRPSLPAFGRRHLSSCQPVNS
jgi:hypothetical protein